MRGGAGDEPEASWSWIRADLQTDAEGHSCSQPEQRLVERQRQPRRLVGELADGEHPGFVTGEDRPGERAESLGECAVGVEELGEVQVDRDQRAPLVVACVDLDGAEADRLTALEDEHLDRDEEAEVGIALVHEQERPQQHAPAHRQADIEAGAGRGRARLGCPAAPGLRAVGPDLDRAGRLVRLVPVEQPHLLWPPARLGERGGHAAGDEHADPAQLIGAERAVAELEAEEPVREVVDRPGHLAVVELGADREVLAHGVERNEQAEPELAVAVTVTGLIGGGAEATQLEAGDAQEDRHAVQQPLRGLRVAPGAEAQAPEADAASRGLALGRHARRRRFGLDALGIAGAREDRHAAAEGEVAPAVVLVEEGKLLDLELHHLERSELQVLREPQVGEEPRLAQVPAEVVQHDVLSELGAGWPVELGLEERALVLTDGDADVDERAHVIEPALEPLRLADVL